jgi:thymidine kinase
MIIYKYYLFIIILHMSTYGTIHLILGPMYSGKTTELLRLKNRSKHIEKKTLCIKYYEDIRYGNDDLLHTHDGLHHNAITSEGKSLMSTFQKIENILDYDEIYIDEIQFYDDADIACEYIANNGNNIIACGLQSDFNRNMFKSIINLFPKCDKITILTAIDKDSKNECSFTKFIGGKDTQFNNGNELIGTTNYYIACDRKNYFKND